MGLEFLLVLLIIFVASFTQGLTGFGFALVAIPLLSLIIDIKLAIPIGALCGLLINGYLFYKMKIHVNLKEVRNLLIGTLFGTPIGTYFLAFADALVIKFFLGIVIVIFVVLSTLKIIKPVNLNSTWGYLFGLFAGILGGAFNTNGPPVLIYMFLKGWNKNEQKAALAGYFLVATVMIIISHLLMGLTSKDVIIKFTYLIPVVFVGIWLGHLFFNKISSKTYNKFVLIGLGLISILLIFKI